MHTTTLPTPANSGFEMTGAPSPISAPSVRTSKVLVVLLGAAAAIYPSSLAAAQ